MTQSYIYLPSSKEISKAVTLVVHGLNNKPSAMMPLASQLCSWGSDVFLVQLTGHTEASSSTPLSEAGWLNDLQQAYQQAISIIPSDQPKPLYFLGYSLGALVNVYMISEHPGKYRYDKMVFLAPALTLRTHVNKLLRLATDILPAHLKIPSLTPKPYRAGAALPLKSYTLLYKMAIRVEKSAFQGIFMPVLVVIDPKDELVNVKKLASYIHTSLPSWQLYTLPKTFDTKSFYAHLILDERSFGKENWERALNQIKVFFQL